MQMYIKKPIAVDALQVPHHSDMDASHTIDQFMGNQEWTGDEDGISITMKSGTAFAKVGDWLIRDVKGEVYPCDKETFEATYEKVA